MAETSNLTADTKVKLGAAIVAMVFCCSYAVWLNLRLASIDFKLAELASRTERIWTWRDMVNYTRTMEELNRTSVPGFKVPPIDMNR